MTFNVRQPDGHDGANNWEFRKDLLLELIVDRRPDLIGTQELFVTQAEFLLYGAPEYAWFGTGRFGDTRDKHVGIFYRKDYLRQIDGGTFWLSETPEVPGTSSWQIIKPRQATWGIFEAAGGLRFQIFNTHFPYRKVELEARRKTAELMLRRIAALEPHLPVLVTADFNSPVSGEIYQLLTGCLQDAWTAAVRRTGPTGTLHGFGRINDDRRIDWILFRAPWNVREIETVVRNRGEVYPSDHHPVMAVFETSSSR